LEEEFEKKFNSLPQYSPITFDRKNSAVPRKKRKVGGGSSEQPKSSKGKYHVPYVLKQQQWYDKLRNLYFLTFLLHVKSVKSKKTFF